MKRKRRKRYGKQRLYGMRVRILQKEELTETIKRDEIVKLPPEAFPDGNEEAYCAIFSERQGGLEAASRRAQVLNKTLPRKIEIGIAIALKDETFEDIIRLSQSAKVHKGARPSAK